LYGSLAMERVLVTGGTGFTGSHLVRNLLGDAHSVRVVARDPVRARELLPPEVEIIAGDITDPEVIARAVRGREVVYHVAAAFREAGIRDSRYREVNLDATRLLLEAARAEGVRRFVHCSTIGVHGHIENGPADESWPHTPGDVYQQTKSEAEKFALDFQRRHDFPLAVVRPTTIYGPGDLRMLKLFRSIARRRFVMLGKGTVCLHMVHVRDLVAGMRLAAAVDAAIGEAFIIGGAEYVTLNDLAARIAALCGLPAPKLHFPVWPVYAAGALCEMICVPLRVEPPLYRRRVAFFTKSRAFRIDKARRMLGYRPCVSLDDGLAETTNWYREKGYL
jgi:nucleoside-diphosphate-sugar epimerase